MNFLDPFLVFLRGLIRLETHSFERETSWKHSSVHSRSEGMSLKTYFWLLGPSLLLILCNLTIILLSTNNSRLIDLHFNETNRIVKSQSFLI